MVKECFHFSRTEIENLEVFMDNGCMSSFKENRRFSFPIDNIIALESTIYQNETSFLCLYEPSVKQFQGQHVLIKLLDLDLITKIIFQQNYWFKVSFSVYSDINTQKNFHTILTTVLWLPFFIIKLFIAHNMHC